MNVMLRVKKVLTHNSVRAFFILTRKRMPKKKYGNSGSEKLTLYPNMGIMKNILLLFVDSNLLN